MEGITNNSDTTKKYNQTITQCKEMGMENKWRPIIVTHESSRKRD
jgi:hypothetical protein